MKLTLEALLAIAPPKIGGKAPKRIRLMRHAFRGHKEQLKKVNDWTKGRANLTYEQAYPRETRDTLGTPTAREVLNAVRLDRTLARLVSAEQGEAGILDMFQTEGDRIAAGFAGRLVDGAFDGQRIRPGA